MVTVGGWHPRAQERHTGEHTQGLDFAKVLLDRNLRVAYRSRSSNLPAATRGKPNRFGSINLHSQSEDAARIT
jgi:hypothetical protein